MVAAGEKTWMSRCYEKMSQGSNFFRIIVHMAVEPWTAMNSCEVVVIWMMVLAHSG